MILNKVIYRIIVLLDWVSQISFLRTLWSGLNNNVIYQVKLFLTDISLRPPFRTLSFYVITMFKSIYFRKQDDSHFRTGLGS